MHTTLLMLNILPKPQVFRSFLDFTIVDAANLTLVKVKADPKNSWCNRSQASYSANTLQQIPSSV